MSDEHDKGPDAPDPDAPDDGGPESDASLQPAGQLDAPVIAALQNDAFPDEPWTQQAVAFLMSARESIAWIATGRDYGEALVQTGPSAAIEHEEDLGAPVEPGALGPTDDDVAADGGEKAADGGQLAGASETVHATVERQRQRFGPTTVGVQVLFQHEVLQRRRYQIELVVNKHELSEVAVIQLTNVGKYIEQRVIVFAVPLPMPQL